MCAETDYLIIAEGYFHRGHSHFVNLQKARIPAMMTYAALEFRCCIERILFEYLYLLDAKNFSKSREKLYLPGKLKREILKVEPEFSKKLEFLNLFLEASGLPHRIEIPDLDRVENLFG